MAQQSNVNRIVKGVKINHPCGDPTLSEEADRAMRREIVTCALKALETDASKLTVFVPDIKFPLS